MLASPAELNFKPATAPSQVVRCERPKWVHEASERTKKAGVRFERRVLAVLKAQYGDLLEVNPWFMFQEGRETRYCSPDAILHLKRPIVLEIKHSHCTKAFFQLHELYIPVASSFFGHGFRAVEVVKWYDPRIDFPGAIELIASIEKAPYAGTGIHIFNEYLGV
jgi:hypothetical protein